MLGLDTLDVGIGMALMFLFVSLICSAVREFGELVLKTRATSLERGVREMLGEGAAAADAAALTRRLYDHPLISALYAGSYATARPARWLKHVPFLGRNGLPSYIPSESFAKAILQIARDDFAVRSTATLASRDLRAWIGENPADPLKRAIRGALDSSANDLALTRAALEHWFDSAMDRVAGWYKRRTQLWLFAIGLGCAVLMNIDALTVMQRLSTDDALRDRVVGAAGVVLAECARDPARCPADAAPAGHAAALTPARIDRQLDRIRSATAQMSQVSWPIGWNGYPDPQYRLFTSTGRTGAPPLAWWLPVIGGWLLTAFGVTFGASFWFDVLNRFMVVRSTIKPDEKSPEEKSKS